MALLDPAWLAKSHGFVKIGGRRDLPLPSDDKRANTSRRMEEWTRPIRKRTRRKKRRCITGRRHFCVAESAAQRAKTRAMAGG